MYGHEVPENIGGQGGKQNESDRSEEDIRLSGGKNESGDDDVFSEKKSTEEHEGIPVFRLYVVDQLGEQCFHVLSLSIA